MDPSAAYSESMGAAMHKHSPHPLQQEKEANLCEHGCLGVLACMV